MDATKNSPGAGPAVSKLVEDDDDESYEDIVVEDEEEYLEYYEEILDEEEDDYTEVTVDEDDANDDENGITAQESSFLPKSLMAEKQSMTVSDPSSLLDNSISNFSESGKPRRRESTLKGFKRPVIKTAVEKALEEEQERIAKEEDEINKTHQFKMARRDSFCLKNEEIKQKLQEEEEQHIREEEERERRRLQEEERLAKKRAEEAAARIKAMELREDRERLEKLEKERLEKEAEDRRLEALKIANFKAAAEKARKEKELLERAALDKKRQEMEEEVRRLEAELAETKRLAAETEKKRIAEQERMQAKVQARRQAKKELEITKHASISEIEIPPSDAAPPAPAPPVATTPPANRTYYPIVALQKKTIPDLDYKNREIYLSPEDFQTLFAMSYEEFEVLPKWKKTNMKRKVKLF